MQTHSMLMSKSSWSQGDSCLFLLSKIWSSDILQVSIHRWTLCFWNFAIKSSPPVLLPYPAKITTAAPTMSRSFSLHVLLPQDHRRSSSSRPRLAASVLGTGIMLAHKTHPDIWWQMKRYLGRGHGAKDGSVEEVLAEWAWGLGFDPQHPHRGWTQ